MVCAINVVVQTHPISSAISLIGVMGSLAVLYLLLGAEFLAVAQMIVYAGAVMVLFVFVIMLLNAGAEMRSGGRWIAQIAGTAAAGRLLGAAGVSHPAHVPGDCGQSQFGGFTGGTAEAVGHALFTDYCCPSK